MNYALRIALLMLITCTDVAWAQVRRTISESFDSQPRYWSYAAEYDNADLLRQYRGGAMVTEVRNGNNFWSLAFRLIDARFAWSVSMQCVITKSISTEGFGIMVLSGGQYYMFKVGGGGRSTWVGRWTENGNTWLNLSAPTKDGQADRPCTCVAANNSTNVLTVRSEKGRLKFMVNATTVEDLAVDSALAPLASRIDAFGILAAGNVGGRIESFDASYTERPMPIVDGAFPKARKTIVKQLLGPSSRYPVMSPNGQHLYYVRTENATSDDIWEADAVTDSTWTDGRSIGTPLNNTAPNNVISVSQDGNELLLWGRYKADGSTDGGGFSTSRRTAAGWSVPTPISAPPYQNKASSREECLSPDRQVLILSRELEGNTQGGKDLYVSFRQPDGSFGPLANLGPNVNSSATEGAPFLAADGRTLYFGSSGDSYGSDDIFVSKRLDDTWLNWSPRINMGPNINSPNWDSYFCIHPSGKYAYMNSSDGIADGIVRIDLPQDPMSRKLLPDPVVIVKGRVLHARTKEPLAVDIRYEDLATQKPIGSAVSEPKNGSYSVVLTGGRSYGFFAERQGFFPVSDNIDVPSGSAYQVIERDLYLEPIEVGSTIRLNNLFFDTDKSVLRTQSDAELRRLITMLTQKPTMKIAIEGHTDDRGSDDHNMVLSKDRAEAVRAYLISKGIDAARLTSQGYGKTRPVTKSTKDADRQRNRRVDFRIVEM